MGYPRKTGGAKEKISLNQMVFKEVLENIDRESLKINDWFNAIHKDFNLKFGEKNIGAIFWRQINTILTSLVIRRIEVESNCFREDLKEKRLTKYPYIDYDDAVNSVNNEGKNSDLSNTGNLRHSTRLFFKLIHCSKYLRKGRRACIGVNAGNVHKKYCLRALYKGYQIKFIHEIQCEIRNLEEQYSILQKKMEIFPEVSPYFKKSDLPGLNSLLKRLVYNWSSPVGKKMLDGVDIILTKTHSGIGNRVLAAEANEKEIPVITIRHGESDGMLDEPLFGYGENTYANKVLSYGIMAEKAVRNSQFLTPLTPDSQTIIKCNSDIYNKLYSREAIGRIKEGGTWMYVPTSLSGFHTYGPYRTIPDELYLKWQLNLLNTIDELKIKLHPKGDLTRLNVFPQEKVIKGNFEDVVELADVLLFDWVSTAFTLGTATTKPIVYLDMGMRNLTTEARDCIEKRCVVVSVDDIFDSKVRDKILSLNHDKDYGGVEKFSIDGTGQKREEKLFEEIGKIA